MYFSRCRKSNKRRVTFVSVRQCGALDQRFTILLDRQVIINQLVIVNTSTIQLAKILLARVKSASVHRRQGGARGV